jgi:hypothetical protein
MEVERKLCPIRGITEHSYALLIVFISWTLLVLERNPAAPSAALNEEDKRVAQESVYWAERVEAEKEKERRAKSIGTSEQVHPFETLR